MFNKLNKIDKKIYIGLFIIAFITAFYSSNNPINFRIMHVDSSVYITVAHGITQGLLPYLDMVDNKGPLTYLFSVPGLLLGGIAGIWITEFLLLCVTAIFAYKTALFFGNRTEAFWGTVFSFTALLYFYFVPAGTEEYSLPFLMISLYIFTKYYFSNLNVSFFELVILGICFACAIMIRLNMFPFWAGFCLVIFIYSIIRGRFHQLSIYILGFCLGIIIVFIPIFLYLKINGIFELFIDNVIISGTKRGFSAGIKEAGRNFFSALGIRYSFLPFLFGLFFTILKTRKNEIYYYFSYTLSFSLLIIFYSFGRGVELSHNNLVLIPFFVPALTYMIDIIHKSLSKRFTKHAGTVVIFFFCVVFAEHIINYCFDFAKIFYDKSGSNLIKAGKLIDENTKPGDKIISLGIDAYIYPFTERTPVSKYFYQGSGTNHIDHIEGARDEFISDVLTGKPEIISFFSGIGGMYTIYHYWDDPIMEMIENEYFLLSNEYDFHLFKRKN
jgi:hypothetical protein